MGAPLIGIFEYNALLMRDCQDMGAGDRGLGILDIDEHIGRMEKIREYADEHGDKRQFMGAIAATITDEASRNYALKKGLFVIEPSGDDVKVIKPQGEVKVW
jgi:hypothetical protein